MSDAYDRPDPVELVDAVREFLDGAGDGARDRLHRRVASNVLATVSRQLAAAPADEAAHADRLAALGVRDNRELAVLAARLDEDAPLYAELTAALATWARAKVAVSNPRYLEEA
ncbi:MULTISPECIES: DUF6285 domain-containing protein [unclassified Nocardioides]|uniref:DUF6285 domain-containing protein n=1 Tax=unclassified Nocardioides TaxID=2615069 RepID=UPI00360B28D6